MTASERIREARSLRETRESCEKCGAAGDYTTNLCPDCIAEVVRASDGWNRKNYMR